MNNSKTFFYCRVSAKDQNLDRQLEIAKQYVNDERDIFCDKASGKDFNREKYQALKATLRTGDLLVVKSLDRLGRNYTDIKNEWKELTDNGINIKVHDMPILDTTNTEKDLINKVIVDVVFDLLSFVAENERNNIKQRQAEGIAIAKAQGKFSKANKITAPEGFSELFIKASNGELRHTEVMQQLNLNKTTYYRLAKEAGLKSSKKIIDRA